MVALDLQLVATEYIDLVAVVFVVALALQLMQLVAWIIFQRADAGTLSRRSCDATPVAARQQLLGIRC